MFKLMGKGIDAILGAQTILIWAYDMHCEMCILIHMGLNVRKPVFRVCNHCSKAQFGLLSYLDYMYKVHTGKFV